MSTARIIRRAALAGAAGALAMLSAAGAPAYERLDQGRAWDEAAWNAYYTLDQGSRLIPFAWAKALKTADGASFLADGLTRYGYLPNPKNKESLPVGFMVADGELGMNCAACHTRQIEYGGKSYRIDGGPAIADIGTLWADLDVAVERVLDEKAFPEFAKAVLGSAHSPEKEKALHEEVDLWHRRHHAITYGGLKAPGQKPWGFGRLDAVGMILNRVTGLDIGDPPDHIIATNIRPADAPVRPPFLWNAPRQNRTQWPGIAENGNRDFALARNLGQVYGVFGKFHPKKDDSFPLGVDFLAQNSANFRGLQTLESLIERIGPPKWPWPIDEKRRAAGKALFEGKGGCAGCHEKKLDANKNWETPITPITEIRTDSRELTNLARLVGSGALTNVTIPNQIPPLKATCESAVNVLGVAIRGALVQLKTPSARVDPGKRAEAMELRAAAKDALSQLEALIDKKVTGAFEKAVQSMKGAYPIPEKVSEECKPPAPSQVPGYESRVLEGVWAAAPYLHNGSVPTLDDLLKPANERKKSFKIGSAYDPDNVGLAAEQSEPKDNYVTDDCSSRPNSGNGNCGHEYGLPLTPEERKDLLEYLKTL